MTIAKTVPGITVAGGILALMFWLRYDPTGHLEARVPGTDGAIQEVPYTGVPAPELGELTRSDGVAADGLPGAWPRFRGEHFDAVSHESTPLAQKWDVEGPPALWSIEVGEGHAGAAVLDGRVYILDYDRPKRADALRCLSLADGKEIWRYSYPVKVNRNHGMSRTVPAVTSKYVVALGPKCHVTCLDSKTGEFRWGLDLVGDFGTKVPMWYAGQCPLIDGERAIIAPGGDALMIAVDCETGETVWETPNPRGWLMSHSSVIPMEFNGRRMYVYCALGGVVGVSTEDGKLLWETDAWKININKATVPSPVVVGDGWIFLSGGYNEGAMMLQLKKDGDGITAEPLFRLKSKVFGCEQHTPVFFEGHIYGVRPNGQLVCLDLDGKILWESGSQERFEKGYGPWMIAGGMIYVMDSEGVLSLVDATPEGYHRLARAKVLDGHDSWGPMAIVDGKLIVRDLTRMVCLDISRNQVEGKNGR